MHSNLLSVINQDKRHRSFEEIAQFACTRTYCVTLKMVVHVLIPGASASLFKGLLKYSTISHNFPKTCFFHTATTQSILAK